MGYSAKYDINVNYPVLVDSIKHLYEQDINGWYLELLDLKSILPEFYNVTLKNNLTVKLLSLDCL